MTLSSVRPVFFLWTDDNEECWSSPPLCEMDAVFLFLLGLFVTMTPIHLIFFPTTGPQPKFPIPPH